KPIAIPATGALSGTPASISDNDAPHTEAIEDEPLDSVMSDTIRQITEETKAAIDIEDNGTVRVFGETKAAAKAAIAKIQAIT
ncbi:KH domain-containing protein, partial [Acinetobacter baumannii]|uniref:KH domain-containing protein n=1 Tax=Acinetobacter baumannii TaxID=470 RepID=UPI0019C178D2|nr:hypothetical protein [Acinetobacter baumannii]